MNLYYRNIEAALGIELGGVWARSWDANRQTLPTATATTAIGNHVDDFIEGMVDNTVKTGESECGYMQDDNKEKFKMTQDFCDSLRSWIRIGYRDALRRYGQQDHGCYDVGMSAHHWTVENSKAISAIAEDEDIRIAWFACALTPVQ